MKRLFKRFKSYSKLEVAEPDIRSISIPIADKSPRTVESNMMQIALADHRMQKAALQKSLNLVLISVVISSLSVVTALFSVAVAIFALNN